jgi:hypothetical protein
LRLNPPEHAIDYVTCRAGVARSGGAKDEIEHLRQRRDQLGLLSRNLLCVAQGLRWATSTWTNSAMVLSGHLIPDAISTARPV